MTHYVSALSIQRLRLGVRLGVSEQERLQPQAVEMDARFYFEELPDCAVDDETESFICYDVICNQLLDYVAGKEFRFVEYLALDLHRVIRSHLDEQLGDEKSHSVKLWIRLLKCNPHVPAMLGGAAFSYSDLPPDAVLLNAG